MVTCRLQAERRTGPVHRPKTGVPPTVMMTTTTTTTMMTVMMTMTMMIIKFYSFVWEEMYLRYWRCVDRSLSARRLPRCSVLASPLWDLRTCPSQRLVRNFCYDTCLCLSQTGGDLSWNTEKCVFYLKSDDENIGLTASGDPSAHCIKVSCSLRLLDDGEASAKFGGKTE